MTLDRGFKAWAERTATSIRTELGLAKTAPLEAARLAEHLDVVLWTCADVPGITPDILQQLAVKDPWGWSAVTVAVQGRIIVVYNDRKSRGRQASDITHELAHVILSHEPATVILSESVDLSMRTFDQKQEDEANCLAWALLLPRDALFDARKSRLSVDTIATTFGVTETLVQYRLRMTGIDVQLQRRRRFSA
jgi:Zn-dependent peptidase ImmA (M78 family)